MSLPPPVNDMPIRVFDSFARMIRDLPARCILKALDLECQTLKEDVESNRLPLPEDALPIFYFREFVHAILTGRTAGRGRPLQPNHVEFFRETLVRLVQANELPQAAMAQFEHAFVTDIFE